ncbi:MAG TPA: MBOAT family O-acyltransferase [Aliidongia sp.]|nr:MBOAT family O-acyltransferase [Aliidongia sp.]
MAYQENSIEHLARRAPRANWSLLNAAVGKVVLCALGLALLSKMSGVPYAPITLGVSAVFSYGVALAVYRLDAKGVRRVIGRIAVPFGFVAIVALNLSGLVGTLTGADSVRSFASLSLVAAPFYILSMCAVIADLANRRIEMPRMLDYLTYVAFPFKLLAGPLEQPGFIRQIEAWRPNFSWSRLAVAWPWAVLGATMKFVIGDGLSPASTLGATDPISAILTAAIFELRFYFDFAGYSFIGYAGALALGFRITQNFAHPFFAPNVVLFWRRWHMSLGRFLARYLLEPNVGMIRGRLARMIFTSGIFFVSALWHGGTMNYAFWGLFHATCYFLWISRLKRHRWSGTSGVAAMILFFVAGRFLAIEADPHRLLAKLGNLLSPAAWRDDLMNVAARMVEVVGPQAPYLAAATLFFIVEYQSVARYGVGRPYHLFRRPVPAMVLLIIALLFGSTGGGLLYARL